MPCGKKCGEIQIKNVIKPVEKKACSLKEYIFQEEVIKKYIMKKKTGKLIVPQILNAVGNDLKNTVFSYIPNTAEVSFYGMVQKVQDFMNKDAEDKILKEGDKISKNKLRAFVTKT